MPHKNIIIPFGYNRLSGIFGVESIDGFFITNAQNDEVPGLSSEQMFKRLVAVTKSKKVIAWEYPTGQFIEFLDSQLSALLTKDETFYSFSSIHTREYGKRYMMYTAPVLEEESKSASSNLLQNQRGQLHSFKLIKYEDSGKPFVHRHFKMHIGPGDYLHFDMEIQTALHIQIDNGYCRQASVF